MNKKNMLIKIRKAFNRYNTNANLDFPQVTIVASRSREVGNIEALVEIMWEEDMISNTTYHNFQALISTMYINA